MSLQVMIQQITTPSFWNKLPASLPVATPRNKIAGMARRQMVMDVLKRERKALSTEEIVDLIFEIDEDVTKNSVACACYSLESIGEVTKELRKIRPGLRVSYWAAK